MPELVLRNDDCQFSTDTTSLRCSNGSVCVDEFWSKCRGDVSYNQLQKFWSELSRQARQELLRIEKQTLFEQARKNMYCSRCNGLLLEGFMQIVMYGKSLQQENAVGHLPCNRLGISKFQNDGDLTNGTGCQGDVQDPSVHPWGGLTTTREGTLTLLDCYLFSTSLKGIQNVFDSARARERERELLYPDACGGGGRGWISQGMASYGRGHGTRETCALHTARLSVDTLVDFWSALGEETRQSLLKMKEEDFIERLMYKFDSKRFCRDCRRNVIREFKELKELKRIRREPRCTSWFCVADTSFQYEVTHDSVQADWRRTFIDTFGTYHHFEWAIGSGEGKSDILEFKNVGLSGRVQVKGLNLCCLNACYITLRAWKIDGSCTEFSVKAHALKGKQCVHCRLVVGDGFVTITRGESIRNFFEHAEEAEEEEDDDSMDKDGNELDGECSRPQKHAKSPELAREFLLDAATVIFKEQVEKAFREGTTRQNAHSIFVSLALKLLEERLHVACKEILTLEKQTKLLQEEEKEKREEEERKERRRMKEREKKLRKKERLREKEKDREKKYSHTNQHVTPNVKIEEPTIIVDEPEATDTESLIIAETGEIMSSRLVSADIEDGQLINGFIGENMQNLFDENCSIEIDYSKNSCLNLKYPYQQDTSSNLSDTSKLAVHECGDMVTNSKQNYSDDYIINVSRNKSGLNTGINVAKSNPRNGGPKLCEKLHCSNRKTDRYDSHACSCYHHNDYRGKVESYYSRTRVGRESTLDMSKPYYSRNKFNQEEYIRDSVGRPKTKFAAGTNPYSRNSPHIKQVWEPMESQKKYSRSNSESDVTLRSSAFAADVSELNKSLEFHGAVTLDVLNEKNIGITDEYNEIKELQLFKSGMEKNCQNGFDCKEGNCQCSKQDIDQEADMSNSLTVIIGPSISRTSNSGSCSSCLSEGDSSGSSSHPQSTGASSASSDSEDASQQSEGIGTSQFLQNAANEFEEIVMDKKQIANGSEVSRNNSLDSRENPAPTDVPKQVAQQHDNGNPVFTRMNLQAHDCPPLYSQSFQFPVVQTSTMGYYHQSPVSWPTAPVNGFMSLTHPNHYLYPSPFRYGVNGNSHFMQCGPVQHLASPLLNPAQVPAYQPMIQTHDINLKEHAVISDQVEVKETDYRANLQPEFLARRGHIGPRQNAAGEQNEKLQKSQNGNADFSLFHFGGPVALANEYKSDSLPSENAVGDLSSVKPIEGNHACNKKDSIEEYNLFAASKGIRFSIF